MDGIGKPVEEDLHLAADVIDIDRRAEDDGVCFLHPGHQSRDIVIKDAGTGERACLAGSAGCNAIIRKVNHLRLCTGSLLLLRARDPRVSGWYCGSSGDSRGWQGSSFQVCSCSGNGTAGVMRIGVGIAAIVKSPLKSPHFLKYPF